MLRSMQLAEISYRGGRVAILPQRIVEYIRRVTALLQLSAETQRQMLMRNFRGDLSVRQVLVVASGFARAVFDIRGRFGAAFSSSAESVGRWSETIRRFVRLCSVLVFVAGRQFADAFRQFLQIGR